MRFIVCCLVFASTLCASECCQLTEDRLTQMVELRPDERVLRGHLWPLNPPCCPTAVVRGIYVHERDANFHDRITTVQTDSGAGVVTVGIPLPRRATLYLRGEGGAEVEENLPLARDNYNVAIYRLGVGGRVPLFSCWAISGDLLVKDAYQGKASIYPFAHTTRYEPNVMVRYSSTIRRAVAAAYFDSLVERDPLSERSYMVERANLLLRYERIYCYPHRALGIEGHFLHYDAPSNDEQRASLWFRTGFPGLERYVFFRYQFDYRRFDKTVPQYLSFNHRVAHTGIFTWQYPLPCNGSIKLEYSFTWMRTRELNDPGQQVQPNGVIVPFTVFKETQTANRLIGQYEQWIGKRVCLFAAGSYYWDLFDYRAWRVRCGLRGSF